MAEPIVGVTVEETMDAGVQLSFAMLLAIAQMAEESAQEGDKNAAANYTSCLFALYILLAEPRTHMQEVDTEMQSRLRIKMAARWPAFVEMATRYKEEHPDG